MDYIPDLTHLSCAETLTAMAHCYHSEDRHTAFGPAGEMNVGLRRFTHITTLRRDYPNYQRGYNKRLLSRLEKCFTRKVSSKSGRTAVGHDVSKTDGYPFSW